MRQIGKKEEDKRFDILTKQTNVKEQLRNTVYKQVRLYKVL